MYSTLVDSQFSFAYLGLIELGARKTAFLRTVKSTCVGVNLNAINVPAAILEKQGLGVPASYSSLCSFSINAW